nr:hypothetical protein [Tanacetum cinerariifolium]
MEEMTAMKRRSHHRMMRMMRMMIWMSRLMSRRRRRSTQLLPTLEDRPEVTLPPWKRLDIVLGPRYEVGKSSSAAATRPAGEARMSREAWVRETDASDLVHGEVMSLRTTVLGQMSEIRELHAVDRRRQTVISELLRIDHRRSTEISELRTALQGQVTALQGQVIALQAQVTTLQGQQGLAGSLTQSELPEEAGGSA